MSKHVWVVSDSNRRVKGVYASYQSALSAVHKMFRFDDETLEALELQKDEVDTAKITVAHGSDNLTVVSYVDNPEDVWFVLNGHDVVQ